MFPTRFLRVFGPLALICTVSFAGPTAKLEQDRARDSSAMVAPRQWFDLLVKIDPQDGVLAAEGLAVKPTPREGADFGAAILPPPDQEQGYARPFTIRLPTRLAKAEKYALEVKVAGKTPAGEPVVILAKGTVRPYGGAQGHVQATVALKEPAVAGKPNAVVVKASLRVGYHVYGAAVDIGLPIVGMLLPAPGARGPLPWKGGGPASPPGKEYVGEFRFEIPFTPVRAGRFDLRVLLDWQACTPMQCDPNELLYLPLSIRPAAGPAAAGLAAAGPGAAGPGAAEAGPGPDKEGAGPGVIGAPPTAGGPATIPARPSRAEKAPRSAGGSRVGDKNLLDLILAAVAAGIFALLMPCTYPLIPITISFFSKQAEQRDGKVAGLALAYGAGIFGIFTLIGFLVGAGLAGAGAVLALANVWWVNTLFAVLFLLFGLSLIGLYDIRLPSWFDDLAAKASGSGGYFGVVAMGATLVITSFTCTAPFIGALLVWAAQGGDLFSATLAMAVFGLTMAIPFVVLSLSPKAMRALPKSGEWMKRLKVTLGIIELGLVLKFVSNIDIAFNTRYIDRELFLVLWASSFLLAGLYLLGFFDLFRKDVRWSVKPIRGLCGTGLVVVAVLLGIGATGKRRGPYIEAFLPPFSRIEKSYHDGFFAVFDDVDEGLAFAQEKGVNVFLHFTGYQ